ncbi:MAG: endolytic transglycosylase MltG [Methylovirgula sp.]
MNPAFEPPAEEARAPARFFSRRMALQSPNEALQPELPPPPPPRRRRPKLSALSGFLSFLLLVSVSGLFAVIWGAQKVQEPGPLSADKILYIAPGTDFPDIVAQLESETVIDNPLIFNIAVMASGKRAKIKAGEYLFKQSASMRDVIDTLVSGKQVLHSVTIPEGLTSDQIVERLRHNDLLLGDIREIPKEGSLLPETYKVPRGMSRAELIRRMQEDQKKLVEAVWAHRASDLILGSPYELVTLASIVEKETGKPEERPHVAAVFLNRLAKRMRLQSDPTIVYGLVGGKGTLGRPIQHAEVEQPTPYNTYVINGLPPGPITNPGRAALEAVANPMQSSDLYFVADGSGGHIFSATLDQHNRNVQHWRQIQKEAKDKAGGDVDHVAPAPPPPNGRPNQHGDAGDGDVYGALPSSLAPATGAAAPSLDFAAAAPAMAKIAPVLPTQIATAAPKPGQAPARSAGAAKKPVSFALSPGIDQLGISVRGVPDGRQAAALLDGPVDNAPTATASADAAPANAAPANAAPIAASAAAPASVTEPVRVSARVTPIAGPAPAPYDPSQPLPTGLGVVPQQQAAASKPVHRPAFDASEGTPLDPLRNKTYDLNYAKTVPTTTSLQ